MKDEDGTRVTGIRQIVRLREMIQKWQSMTISSRESPDEKSSGIPPAVEKRVRSSYYVCDSDEETCQSPEPPPDVPKGYLAVYVGPELRRFIIPTTYLSLPVFKVLLEKAEEEFGFEHKGGLTLPCEIETFKYILQCIKHNKGLLQEDHDGNPSTLDDESDMDLSRDTNFKS
ncbi:uncharacterized protein LOC143880860 [Tasmannia lanceolata]|uniref:uncharacterized protein LOC143880860 n=1 Tax=Tasmannia lanceolata TaxID=3420 RepID=UPI0040642410